MRALSLFRFTCLLLSIFLARQNARACGYDYVTWCANEMDFSVNGQPALCYVQACTWMNNFQNYNFGTVSELTLTRGLNTTWESCDNVVMNATLYYRIYATNSLPGNFTALNLPQLALTQTGAYRNRTYSAQPALNILAGLASGSYYLEVYFRSDVDFNNDNTPDGALLRDNGGLFYKATFTKTGGGEAPCSIAAALSGVQCDDNGTASNPADDTYKFGLTVTGSNTGAGWHAMINGVPQNGTYGGLKNFGPYPIAGGNLNFTVVDDAHTGCTTAVTIVPPPVCSSVPVCQKSVLFVVGKSSLGPGDVAVKNRLETALNASVTVKPHGAATAADASGKDLVIISSSVTPEQVNTKFRDVAVPVLLWEYDLFDDMNMTGPMFSIDFGTKAGVNAVLIADPAHPVAAGLNGSVTVFSSNTTVHWGKPAETAEKIARIDGSGNATKWLVWGYEAGAPMVGMAAPARRVGLLLNNTSATLLNDSGWALFDAAYRWAVGCASAMGPGEPEISEAAVGRMTTNARRQDFLLYPNPADGENLNLDLREYRGRAAHVWIANPLGQSLRTYELTAGASGEVVQLSLGGLHDGQYFLFVQADGRAPCKGQLFTVFH